MMNRPVPYYDFEIEEPFDYWDRGRRSTEYRFLREPVHTESEQDALPQDEDEYEYRIL